MRLVLITPGTGSYYCGVCMRDNALVKALNELSHQTTMFPMYLPLLTDEPSQADNSNLVFGGINVYLQQKSSLFRKTPNWLDNLFDAPALLKFMGQLSGMTSSSNLGEITVSVLQAERGKQAKEVGKLIDRLRQYQPIDAVILSTALQIGLARAIKEQLHLPIIAFLQGEDNFLDLLPSPYSSQAWSILQSDSKHIDQFIAPSAFFAAVMKDRLGIDTNRLCVIPNGINLEDYQPAQSPPQPPTIGYLARLTRDKGLGTSIKAYIHLKREGRYPGCRLEVAGTLTSEDRPFVDEQRRLLKAAGVESSARFRYNLTRSEKVAFLRNLTLFSVPAHYGEAFGLYLLEAMAAAIPVVQPEVAAFPEIVRETGGGLLYQPNTPEALAVAWESLLDDPLRARALGVCGRQIVVERYDIRLMAESVASAISAHLR